MKQHRTSIACSKKPYNSVTIVREIAKHDKQFKEYLIKAIQKSESPSFLIIRYFDNETKDEPHYQGDDGNLYVPTKTRKQEHLNGWVCPYGDASIAQNVVSFSTYVLGGLAVLQANLATVAQVNGMTQANSTIQTSAVAQNNNIQTSVLIQASDTTIMYNQGLKRTHFYIPPIKHNNQVYDTNTVKLSYWASSKKCLIRGDSHCFFSEHTLKDLSVNYNNMYLYLVKPDKGFHGFVFECKDGSSLLNGNLFAYVSKLFAHDLLVLFS
jgi:hypothetical protein